MDDAQRRKAANEAVFREVNEQVRSLSDPGAGDTEAGFVCECSTAECMERIQVPLSVYEAVRGNGRRFLVQPGHEGGMERVVERHDGYVVVEKVGVAGEIAETVDPRA